MPRVFNKHHRDAPDDAVYVGRGSPYGNRFVIGPVAEGKHGTRDVVIAAHRAWLATQPDLIARIRKDLAGRDLVCFCAPSPCHGDTLLEIANGPIVEHRDGDLLAQRDLDAVAHGVNCQGVMGAGIAKAFKSRYPMMYETYRAKCADGSLTPGRGFAWDTGEACPAWVYNLATQDRPGPDARLEAVEMSLTGALAHAARHGVRSFGLPRIGAGIGGLDWNDVEAVVERVATRSLVSVVVVTL